jgi:hypothetical protein
MASSHKIEVGSFCLHATRLVCPGTSRAIEWLFLLKCEKVKLNIFYVHLVQIRPKKITELSRYSCMVTTKQRNLLHFKRNNPSAAWEVSGQTNLVAWPKLPTSIMRLERRMIFSYGYILSYKFTRTKFEISWNLSKNEFNGAMCYPIKFVLEKKCVIRWW